MKVTIDKSELYSDPEIIVKCKDIDDVIQDIISYIGIADKNMIGDLDGELFFIPLNSILYFDSVDKIVYIYTDKQVYRSSAKLYLLEEQLVDTYFARISKTTILNLKKLNSVRKVRNAKLEGTLINNEKTLISRQYVAEIKKRLGV